MFTDAFINKEDNFKIFKILFNYLTNKIIKLNKIDALNPEIETYFQVPDTISLSNNVKSCLQENDEILLNVDNILHNELFTLNLNFIPKAIE